MVPYLSHSLLYKRKQWELWTILIFHEQLVLFSKRSTLINFLTTLYLVKYCLCMITTRIDYQQPGPDDYLVDSFDTWLCLHPFRSKNSSNCRCMFTHHVLNLICKACDNLRMRGHTSKIARSILNDVRATMPGNVWASLWHLLEALQPGQFLKTKFQAF